MEVSYRKQFVKDLTDKTAVDTFFLVKEKQLLHDKNDKPYLSLSLSDVTGSIGARLWDKAEDLSRIFNAGDIIRVKGHVQVYQNKKQIVIHDLGSATSKNIRLTDFWASAPRSADEMWGDLQKLVAEIRDGSLRKLVELCLEDPQIESALKVAPAAKTIHHAYIGGLLEHILSICHVLKSIAIHYPFLNSDYLIFGGIFHDIGKIWELTIRDGIQYTDRGRLVGHMVLACELIDQKAALIPDFPIELKDVCKHIILSHHGKLEYGSPKRPKFLEAYVVAMIDDMDSKLNTMRQVMSDDIGSPDKWTRFNTAFDRYFYLEILRKQLVEPTE